jgi:serine-type D-Ala-D-Ala carboxypeptidase/endopeptidase (penicillin-binding protein 4)
MTRSSFIVTLAGTAFAKSSPATGPRLAAILKSNNRVHFGIHAVQMRTGRTVMSVNADKFFVPASNMKLFATAFALDTLGLEHRFVTRVLASNNVDSSGRLSGDLTLMGGGDPSFSSRRYPYDRKNPFAEDRLEPLRMLARQLKDRGLTHVEGGIVGDDTLFEHDPVPNGWSADDGLFEYGAPVSALSFDNTIAIKAGPDSLALDPPVEYFSVLNETGRAAGPRRVRVERQPGSRVVRVFGNVPPGAADYENDLAVDDPALYAAECLREVLRAEGIRVDGRARARHVKEAAEPGVELARRESAPMADILQVVDKVSQNLHAELVLRAALAKSSWKDFLGKVGIDEKETNFEDGSGMSRLALVTPKAVVQLLREIGKGPNFERFRAFLPIGGEDGTLRGRFNKHPLAARITAKTGSLSHVSALGGFAESKRLGTIAFQIVANNYNTPSQEVRTAIDQIALALVQ